MVKGKSENLLPKNNRKDVIEPDLILQKQRF